MTEDMLATVMHTIGSVITHQYTWTRTTDASCLASLTYEYLHTLLSQGRTVTKMPFARAEHADSFQN